MIYATGAETQPSNKGNNVTNMQASAPIVDLEATTPQNNIHSVEPFMAAPTKEQINDNIKRSYKSAVAAVESSAREVADAQRRLQLAEETERAMRPMVRLVDASLIPDRFKRTKKG